MAALAPVNVDTDTKVPVASSAVAKSFAVKKKPVEIPSCSVCCSDYVMEKKEPANKTVCYHCKYDACRKCVKRYLLSSINDPHCMSCKKPWDEKHTRESLGLQFIDGCYKEYKTTLMMVREKAMLPETQLKFERLKTIQELNNKIRNRQAIADKQIRKIQKECDSDNKKYHDKLVELTSEGKDAKHVKDVNDVKYVQKCPNDECRGFLSTRWKCGLCDVVVCAKCHEIKNSNDCKKEHKCKKENIESVIAKNKESRPCPKCTSRISKIEGCDQMFCTQCKTTFSWNTGKIETKIFHNPHYYEWKRAQAAKGEIDNVPRNGGDVPCGGLPCLTQILRMSELTPVYNQGLWTLHNKPGYKNGKDDKEKDIKKYNILNSAYMKIGYNIDYAAWNEKEENNEDLRMKFLRQDIDEDEWTKKLLQRKKKMALTKDYWNLMLTWNQMATDAFQKLDVRLRASGCDKKKVVNEAVKELESSRDYINDMVKSTLKKYNSKAFKTLPEILFAHGIGVGPFLL